MGRALRDNVGLPRWPVSCEMNTGPHRLGNVLVAAVLAVALTDPPLMCR
jgi:hypothetical protein